MKKEKNNFLAEAIMRLRLLWNKKVNFNEVYQSILLTYPEVLEGGDKFKQELKEIIEKINKLDEKQMKELLKKTKIDTNKITIKDKPLNVRDYISKVEKDQAIISVANRYEEARIKELQQSLGQGKFTAEINSPEDVMGDNFLGIYNKLYGRGRISSILNETLPFRNRIFQGRTTCEVSLYAKAEQIGTFVIVGILPEHSIEIIGYWKGRFVDKSTFGRDVKAFEGTIKKFGIKSANVTSHPLKSAVCDDVRIRFEFA